MPAIVITLANTHETVTRPVVLDVMRHLFTITGINNKTDLSFPDDLNKSKQTGSTINKEAPKIKFSHGEKLSIEVEENYEQERLLTTAVVYPENRFIFSDNSLRVYIKPVYSSADITVNIKYRAPDRTTAMRWRDNMRKHVAMGKDIDLHHLNYSYLIPKECLVLMKEIHRLRENVEPYGETFDQWFNQCITSKLTTLTNLSGTEKELAIAETQMRVQGYFDFEGAPEKGERTDDGDSWTISVAYKFKYDKPIGCVVRYPVMVHNQLIDTEFLPLPVDTPDKYLRRYNKTGSNLAEFEVTEVSFPKQTGYSMPDYDDFVPTSYLPSTMRVFTALTAKDTDYPTHLFSLLELGDIELKPEIIEFMRGEYRYMNKPYASVFNMSIFCMSVLLPPDNIYVDADLDVHANFDRNPRNYHHVNLSIVTDLSMLSPLAKERLRLNGNAFIAILDTIAPYLRAYNALPTILANGSVTTYAFNRTIEYITGGRPIQSAGNYGIPNTGEFAIPDDLDRYRMGFNTVESLFVQAERIN